MFHGYALHDVTPGFQPNPTNLVATAGAGQISLSWNTAPGATGYTVKRSLTTGGPYTTVGSPTGTTYLDTSLTGGIRYYYVVSATTALGETPNSAQASAVPTTPLVAPTNLASTAGNNAVGLTWTASSGATSYNVKRATVSGGPYTTLGTGAATTYNDATASNGTTWYYVVSATDSSGESANSSQVSALPHQTIADWRPGYFSAAEITAGLAANGADPDGDGISNLDEYLRGTNPRTATLPGLTITGSGNNCILSFTARSATGTGYVGLTRKYDLVVSPDIKTPSSWVGVSGYTNIVGGGQTVTTTPLPISPPNKCYRLKVWLE